MAITTVEEVQKTLGITGKEAQIEELIPKVEEWIKGYCNIDKVPSEYNLNAIKMIEYNLNRKTGVSSESLSRHSISFVTEYPQDITKGLRRRLRW